MCEVMEQLRDELRDESIERTRLEDIKNIMKKLGYTIQQAMDLLDIPAAEQDKYLAKL